ncbi:MAG: hypothetical protein V2I33_17130 [Kangiellaceae bacterium]|jgi:hypothetical protein|nr:hypothetical protein [Kangiellaceae bacterium]
MLGVLASGVLARSSVSVETGVLESCFGMQLLSLLGQSITVYWTGSDSDTKVLSALKLSLELSTLIEPVLVLVDFVPLLVTGLCFLDSASLPKESSLYPSTSSDSPGLHLLLLRCEKDVDFTLSHSKFVEPLIEGALLGATPSSMDDTLLGVAESAKLEASPDGNGKPSESMFCKPA